MSSNYRNNTAENNTPPPNHSGQKAHLARWVLCTYVIFPACSGLVSFFIICDIVKKGISWEISLWGLLLVVSIYMSYMILRKWNDYIIVSSQGIEIHVHPGWFIFHHRTDFFIRWIDVKWWRIHKRKDIDEITGRIIHWNNKLIIQPKYQEEPLSFAIEDYHATDKPIPRRADFNRKRVLASIIYFVFAFCSSQPLSSMLDNVAGQKRQKYIKK